MRYVDLLCRQTRRNRVAGAQIGVISPYAKQCEKISKALKMMDLAGPMVGSVENFQVRTTFLSTKLDAYFLTGRTYKCFRICRYVSFPFITIVLLISKNFSFLDAPSSTHTVCASFAGARAPRDHRVNSASWQRICEVRY